ncbi:acyl-CoA carboxylase epsilon subunit [Mycolicibacterium sp. 120270]|uniref:acyl-CoA carboxylase epsilon subunit n=1 Tax=Mycolicibacterium sp. 120270 TaxID=3090600 RepID=UPI00299F44BE|nr:acyl-CoA carboxylase epsilon subunit [Mycolicibacterium sp. 120270]MDX1884100.1 acyl-CoA carboxylase epsilon subunit [Mycolicibacterium sp. 120270]
MSKDEHHITEVSDPRALTIDDPATQAVKEITVLKGEPTAEELAALVAVLSAASGGRVEPGPQELNLWGHPVDKLRYETFSWQRVTLLERTHMRR